MITDDEAQELDRLSDLSGMPVPPAYREGVLRQWRLNQALAAPLLTFEFPDDIPPAPVFEP
jgi:hypothetical protein